MNENYDILNETPTKKSSSKKKKTTKKILIIPIVILIVLCIGTSLFSVNQNEYAYVTRFSKMVNIYKNPGAHFKIPLIDKVTKIPSYQMIYDIPPSEVITKDKKTMVIDNYAIWKVSDPQKFMKTVRGSVSEMESRISAAVYSAVKNEFGRLLREEIISTDPTSVERVAVRATEEVRKVMEDYGIHITSVEIKKTDLPEANAESVYERMIADREKIATAYIAEGKLEANRIRNEVDQKVQIIIAEAEASANKRMGEAEAKYMEIMASAYSNSEKAEFYKFLRELDALKASFNNGGTTLILDESSPIVEALIGNN